MVYKFLLIIIILFSTAERRIDSIMNKFMEQGIAEDSVEVVEQGAALELVSDQFSFTEGPACDRNGNIYFTDQPNNKIWRYDTEGKLEVFLDKAGRSNGLYFNNEGDLIACADENFQLWKINQKKEITVLLKEFKGLNFNGPNDVWVSKNSDIYFTDPYYQRDYWSRTKPEMDGQKVYLLKKGRKEPVVVDSKLKKPNGLIGTPDGRHLFVADIDDNRIYKYEIDKSGLLKNRVLFTNQGGDGMTIDNKGNIYLAGKGVTVFNQEGKKISYITVPEDWTGNVTFGGKEKDYLFIAASKSLYKIKMKVRGAN